MENIVMRDEIILLEELERNAEIWERQDVSGIDLPAFGFKVEKQAERRYVWSIRWADGTVLNSVRATAHLTDAKQEVREQFTQRRIRLSDELLGGGAF
jgi:hypothetical protein